MEKMTPLLMFSSEFSEFCLLEVSGQLLLIDTQRFLLHFYTTLTLCGSLSNIFRRSFQLPSFFPIECSLGKKIYHKSEWLPNFKQFPKYVGTLSFCEILLFTGFYVRQWSIKIWPLSYDEIFFTFQSHIVGCLSLTIKQRMIQTAVTPLSNCRNFESKGKDFW